MSYMSVRYAREDAHTASTIVNIFKVRGPNVSGLWRVHRVTSVPTPETAGKWVQSPRSGLDHFRRLVDPDHSTQTSVLPSITWTARLGVQRRHRISPVSISDIIRHQTFFFLVCCIIFAPQLVAANSLSDAQQELAAKGYLAAPADGKMGEKTRRAIKRFQQDHHLHVTGVLDHDTAAALFAAKRPDANTAATTESLDRKGSPVIQGIAGTPTESKIRLLISDSIGEKTKDNVFFKGAVVGLSKDIEFRQDPEDGSTLYVYCPATLVLTNGKVRYFLQLAHIDYFLLRKDKEDEWHVDRIPCKPAGDIFCDAP